MKAANFSADRVAKFECDAGKRQTFFRDGKTPGLGLRVTAAGSKTYVFETRLRNRTMRLTIGDVRTWTISAAQKEATRLKTLTDTGLDPRKVKAEQDAAEEAARRELEGHALLVREAWDKYLKHHAKRWGQKYMESHLEVSKAGGEKKKKGGGQGLTMPGVLTPILQMRMKDVTARVLTDWVDGGSSATQLTRVNMDWSSRHTLGCSQSMWRAESWRIRNPSILLHAAWSIALGPKHSCRRSKQYDPLCNGQGIPQRRLAAER